MKQSPLSKKKILNLSLNYLNEKANEKECISLFDLIDENLEKRNQELFDFLSDEIEKKNPELRDSWIEFMGSYCGSLVGLMNHQGQEMEATLFLIPVVLGFYSETKDQNDSFQIVNLGKVRELMVKANLISGTDENISLLTQLFSFDEVVSFTETQKHQLLQYLLTGNKKHALFQNPLTAQNKIRINQLDLRLKFLIGCAQLKKGNSESGLSHILATNETDISDDQLEKSFDSLGQFSIALSETLPELLCKKEGVQIRTSYTLSTVEFTRFGFKMTIKEYDQFKFNLLLAETQKLNQPRIRIFQSNPEFLEFSLLDGNQQINQIQIYSMCDSPEEVMDFLNHTFDELESFGFSLESDSDLDLVFSKKPKREKNASNLRVLH